jgi:hypothetical protein
MTTHIPEPPRTLVERLKPYLGEDFGERRTVTLAEIKAGDTTQHSADFERDSDDETIKLAVDALRQSCAGMKMTAHRVVCLYMITLDAEVVRIDVWGDE